MRSDNHFHLDGDITTTGEHLLQALLDAGYSSTLPRQATTVIANASGYLSPPQILDSARRFSPRIGLVTVYRTLDILAQMGLVRKVHLADGCHSYALAEKAHGHHVICEACQQVMEFEGCNLRAAVEQQTGYQVKQHWLELFGLCPACRQKAQQQGG